jgi:CDP-diacylglycerol--inositol 3-phosphatidyltransferase
MEKKANRTPVYLFIPNLIGYLRIIFAAVSFYYIYSNYWFFYLFYSLSAVLDMADGHAARKFNQTSKFGAVLDMITDRASTSCLIVVLAQFYEKYSWAFLFFIALDLMSHFARIYSSLIKGPGAGHKDVDAKTPTLLRIYYSNRYVLAFLCFGNEGFFIMLYMYHWLSGPLLNLGPLAFLASYFGGAAGQLGLVPASTFLFFAPIMAVKQYINLIQLVQSCKDLIAMDEAARDQAEQLKKAH